MTKSVTRTNFRVMKNPYLKKKKNVIFTPTQYQLSSEHERKENVQPTTHMYQLERRLFRTPSPPADVRRTSPPHMLPCLTQISTNSENVSPTQEKYHKHVTKFNPWKAGNGLPGLHKIMKDNHSKWETTKFFMGEGIVKPMEYCPKCEGPMTFLKSPFNMEEKGTPTKTIDKCNDAFKVRCKNRECNVKCSVYKDSFFSGLKKSPQEMMIFFHLWLAKADRTTIMGLLKWSEPTVIKMEKRCREIVSIHIYGEIEEGYDTNWAQVTNKIGGPGIEVQIDESAFGKRKYNRGHQVNTKWVVGGVEIVPDATGKKRGGKVFFVVVPDRTMQTLHRTIQTHVEVGSHIITDCWKGYNNLDKCGYLHDTVNHSKWYKDPKTGLHTNTIEGKWNGVKGQMPRQAFRNPYVLQTYLGEVMWRTKFKGDLWFAFLGALRYDTQRHFELGGDITYMPFEYMPQE